MKGCISFESYIKPQRWSDGSFKLPVVYLLNPTSNHNTMVGFAAVMALYIFWILHQTTTKKLDTRKDELLYIFWILHQTTTVALLHHWRIRLYIFWILHQTTTIVPFGNISILLYIFWILHQTTTLCLSAFLLLGCISFESYIKPQPALVLKTAQERCISFESYIKPQLRMLTETSIRRCISFESYIKPQPQLEATINKLGCISFEFYIKPQLNGLWYFLYRVVYLLNPTSNHNSHSW